MAYTYLIGWSKHKKYYYGVRFSKKSDPKELWVTYFTSSKKDGWQCYKDSNRFDEKVI